MKEIILSFIYPLISLLIIDGIWLSTMWGRFYSKYMSQLVGPTQVLPIGLFYIIYSIGLSFLIILPAVRSNQALTNVFISGLILGLMAYSAYDLTNQAVIKGWSWNVTVVDIIWGSLLTGVVSVISVWLLRY